MMLPELPELPEDALAFDAELVSLIDDQATFNMSDSTSSGSESSTERVYVAPPPRKTLRKGRKIVGRPAVKATYHKRKDEIQELQEQVKQLEARLQKASANAPFAQLKAAAAVNDALSSGVDQNHLVMAGTESMLSNYKQMMARSSATTPLKKYIHLPVDVHLRSQILDSMMETKLEEAFQFMKERTQFLDLSVLQGTRESFDLPNGDMGLISFDVVQFRTGHSVRQVYEALQMCISNQEMTVSERLGVLTVRESDDMPSFKFGQARMLSTIPEGLEVESNHAMFGGYYEATETSSAYAVVASDFVDQDELHPYRADHCGRKQIVGAMLLSEVPSPTGRVVALTRWSTARLCPPAMPLTEELKEAAREKFLGWCHLMPGIMQQWLDAQPPAK